MQPVEALEVGSIANFLKIASVFFMFLKQGFLGGWVNGALDGMTSTVNK